MWANSILADRDSAGRRWELPDGSCLVALPWAWTKQIRVSEHSDQLRTILNRLLARTTEHSIPHQPVSRGSQAGAGSTALASALGCGGVFGLRAGLATSSVRLCDDFTARPETATPPVRLQWCRSGARAIQSQGSGSGSAPPRVCLADTEELRVALWGQVLAVDKEGEEPRRRGLEDMAGRDDQVVGERLPSDPTRSATPRSCPQ